VCGEGTLSSWMTPSAPASGQAMPRRACSCGIEIRLKFEQLEDVGHYCVRSAEAYISQPSSSNTVRRHRTNCQSFWINTCSTFLLSTSAPKMIATDTCGLCFVLVLVLVFSFCVCCCLLDHYTVERRVPGLVHTESGGC
jgi:hypothetical protein